MLGVVRCLPALLLGKQGQKVGRGLPLKKAEKRQNRLHRCLHQLLVAEWIEGPIGHPFL